MHSSSYYLGIIVAIISIQGCVKTKKGSQNYRAKLNSLNESNATPLATMASPDAAFKEVQNRGYLKNPDCAASLKGGEELMFATGSVEEIGQAGGVIKAVGDKMLFIQKTSLSDALLFAPGVTRSAYEHEYGMSSENAQKTQGEQRTVEIQSTLDVAAYLRLACRVAFARDQFNTGAIYQKVEIGELDGTGGTAGLEIKPQHFLVVKLTRLRSGKETARFKLYLSKENGPVVVQTEVARSSWSTLGANLGSENTINVYINYAGGDGIGKAATIDPRIKNCQVNGGTWNSSGETDEAKCYRFDASMTRDDCVKLNIPFAVTTDSAGTYLGCKVHVKY